MNRIGRVFGLAALMFAVPGICAAANVVPVVDVPEPATAMLLALGGAGALIARRFRK